MAQYHAARRELGGGLTSDNVDSTHKWPENRVRRSILGLHQTYTVQQLHHQNNVSNYEDVLIFRFTGVDKKG